MIGGSPLERTASNIDAAEVDLLRLAPVDYLQGQLPSLLCDARSHLDDDDPRRRQLETICAPAAPRGVSAAPPMAAATPTAAAAPPVPSPLTETEKNTVIATARATRSAARREVVRVRSFRNILHIATTVLTIAVLGLIAIAATNPGVVPLCFKPQKSVVCPTDVASGVGSQASAQRVDEVMRATAQSWDVSLVALLGLIAAAVSSAVTLRNLKGTNTPYALPVAVAVLKLPTGALTAVLGLLLMRGEFVPGLSALDSPGQILAWAILFGYAQQLFTRFVDQRADTVLGEVSSPPELREPEPPTITRSLPQEAPANGAPVVKADAPATS